MLARRAPLRRFAPPRARAPARAPRSYTGHTFAKFIITIFTGLLTGAFAVALSKSVGALFEWKNARVQALLDAPGEGRVWAAFAWHVAYSCGLVSFAVTLVRMRAHVRAHAHACACARVRRPRGPWLFAMGRRARHPPAARRLSPPPPAPPPGSPLFARGAAQPPPPPPPAPAPQVQYWAPQSAGAGVTLVMAYLNGNHVPNLLRLRTLVSKFVGTICSVAAGLPMGPEGPMVHMGACVASVITYAQCSESRRLRAWVHACMHACMCACAHVRMHVRAARPRPSGRAHAAAAPPRARTHAARRAAPRRPPRAAACIRTGRWLSCFGRRRLKGRDRQMLERMKVLDDIVSDSGARPFHIMYPCYGGFVGREGAGRGA